MLINSGHTSVLVVCNARYLCLLRSLVYHISGDRTYREIVSPDISSNPDAKESPLLKIGYLFTSRSFTSRSGLDVGINGINAAEQAPHQRMTDFQILSDKLVSAPAFCSDLFDLSLRDHASQFSLYHLFTASGHVGVNVLYA